MQNPLIHLLVVGLLWAPGLAAQDAEGERAPGEVFFDTVDVNVVNVEVYVTDKQGNRIRGLTKDDFELEVDRKPVAITNFYAVEGGEVSNGTRRRGAAGKRRTVDQHRNLGLEERKIPEQQRLHLIVYVDNLNLRPFNRNRALGYVRTFLRTKLRPGDEVMLATYERSLHIRHPFTSDPDLVASALFEIEEMSAMGISADSDRRDLMREIYNSEDIYDVRGRANQYVESLYSDLRFTVDALKGFVDELAGLPGRKAILYVSDGLPMRAGEDVFHALQDRFATRGRGADGVLMDVHRYDLSRNYQELTAKANTNRVTFYTLEAAGLRTYSFMEAASDSIGGGSRIDQIHFSNVQSPLRLLAQETGGLAILNTNNFEPMLSRIAGDFDTYYSLGFIPAGSDSGRYHDIRVQLKDRRKGTVLRHREGYRDKPVSSRMVDATMAALNFGYQANPLQVELEIGPQTPHTSSGQILVTVYVKIPIGRLSFLPQEEMYRGRVRLFIGAKDSEGGVAPVQDVPLPIDIPAAEIEVAKERFYQYEMKLLMRPGRQVVAVGVRDEIGAVTGFVARGLSVGI